MIINECGIGKNLKFLFLLLVGLFCFRPEVARAQKAPLFAGGMFYTIAPLKMAEPVGTFPGMGVGGRLYFYLGPHIRLGGMGSLLKKEVGQLGHSFKLGGGGLLFHYCHRFSFFELGVGFLVGGQKLSLDLVTAREGEFYTVKRLRQGHWLLSPQLDFTFQVTKKLQLFLLTEYRHPYFTNYLLGHTVQFYLGIHFSH